MHLYKHQHIFIFSHISYGLKIFKVLNSKYLFIDLDFDTSTTQIQLKILEIYQPKIESRLQERQI